MKIGEELEIIISAHIWEWFSLVDLQIITKDQP